MKMNKEIVTDADIKDIIKHIDPKTQNLMTLWANKFIEGNAKLRNAVALWADKFIVALPRFHSPKSRRFKCNKCGRLHKWTKGQVTINCGCGKQHIRFLGSGKV